MPTNKPNATSAWRASLRIPVAVLNAHSVLQAADVRKQTAHQNHANLVGFKLREGKQSVLSVLRDKSS